MSGCTAGGMKCIRIAAAFKLLLKELKQVIHPSAVLTVKVNDKTVRPEIASAIWGFMFIYLFIFTVITALLAFEGLDLVSAGTAAISSLSNIGPAYGVLGPYDNYSLLTDFSKLIFSAGMILGRLEFYTVLVIFTAAFWRK